jgi:hypothetical protein
MSSESFRHTLEILMVRQRAQSATAEVQRAAALDVLHVGTDLFSEVYLCPSGEVLRDEDGEITLSAEPNELSVVLRVASRRFPELAQFIPGCPADGIACEKCGASGLSLDRFCFVCLGRGWLPATQAGMTAATAKKQSTGIVNWLKKLAKREHP